MADDDFLIQTPPKQRRWLPRLRGSGWRRMLKWIGIFLLIVIVFYYPLGALYVHEIDDDPNFGPGDVAPGASRAVAMAAALIDREVNQHEWPANDPWFLPGAILDNMPNYQIGIITALRRFAQEMTDQISRVRGSSPSDPDMEAARSRLNNDPDIWVVDFRISAVGVTSSSERLYRSGRDSLLSYNRRLAAGQAVFERRADNLQYTIDRIAKDLGSLSAILERQVETGSQEMIDFNADNVFYETKGELYAYALILRELGADFDPVIKQRNLTVAWTEMVDNLEKASQLQPWVVVNGAPDSAIFPSHLSGQGLFLLRARTQLGEISDILLK
ncbi:MAG TPA: DUF2333 family protein [Dongiaceae bacterium]|jgi:hypothetical protein